MDVDEQMIAAINSLYSSPTFAVKIGAHVSDYERQLRGIRQGCPLSPYLFLVVMTVMFRDIHSELNLTRGTWGDLDYTELLYADDTVLVTNNAHAMNRFLSKVEQHASYFGLRFNQGKCVAMGVNTDAVIPSGSGAKVKKKHSTIYLGACINDTDNPKENVKARLGACFAVLNKLHHFWKHSNCPSRFKLNVFHAVIRSKLVYSLEAVQLTPALLGKLNALQFKGLRKILNIEHTYINRANTNVSILQTASSHKNPSGKPNKNIRPFSEYVQDKQESLLKHTVRIDRQDFRTSTSAIGSYLR